MNRKRTARRPRSAYLGGVDWPDWFAPQQVTLSSVRMPQVWSEPARIALKVPEGGDDWP
jgi:hypothetical protein